MLCVWCNCLCYCFGPDKPGKIAVLFNCSGSCGTDRHSLMIMSYTLWAHPQDSPMPLLVDCSRICIGNKSKSKTMRPFSLNMVHKHCLRVLKTTNNDFGFRQIFCLQT